ncbi:hypothetical protein M5K25_004758 [Dendrobium thyrsiflorum]|uniref:Uncharacterized protein n=1 Tax=Dendrobium thyrsiflorum TaxID=117978 RepID=A0ABD0VN20_DENTH
MHSSYFEIVTADLRTHTYWFETVVAWLQMCQTGFRRHQTFPPAGLSVNAGGEERVQELGQDLGSDLQQKPVVRKGKKRLQKAFWADSVSDSSETTAEEEVTNLCLMTDNLDHSDQEEVSDLSYEELFEVSERIHSAYRKLKKMHASLSLEHLNLQKEFEILKKNYALIDDTHMKLLDEFDELKKMCDELEKLNDEMERDGKTLIDENNYREYLVNIEIMGLKHMNAYFERKWKESEDNRKIPALVKNHTRQPKNTPRGRHQPVNRLIHPFPGVKCFSCRIIGHITNTCIIHSKKHLVWRPKFRPDNEELLSPEFCNEMQTYQGSPAYLEH